MLDKQTRGAILLLRSKGHSLRCISRLLSLSRDSVRQVVKVGSDEPPIIVRSSKLDAHRERIAQMLAEFDGNVVKVHRALADGGTSVRYPTLTAFCRNNHLLDSTCDPNYTVYGPSHTSAGVVVLFSTDTVVPAVPPNVTVAPEAKFVPVIVTPVPRSWIRAAVPTLRARRLNTGFSRSSGRDATKLSQEARLPPVAAGWLKHVRGQVKATGLESFGELGPDACGSKNPNRPAIG